MRFRKLVLGAFVAIVGLINPANAATGTINYQIGSGSVVPVTSEQDFSINVGTISGTVVVRIWDPSLGSGIPDDGVGKITINGSWSSGELQIIVAGTGDSWPALPSVELLNPGLRDLGLNSGDGIEVTDSDLRKHTRLAAYVSGDINGTIEVGQVQRIQCGFSTTNATPGTINASITAIAPNSLFAENAIGRIYAGNAINGHITATGDSSYVVSHPSTYASIGRVVVGPDAAAGGILGNIKAEKGTVHEIYTTGPIGSQTVTPSIWAADGIYEIRAVSESDLTEPIAADFIADIRSNLHYSVPSNGLSYPFPPIDAPLKSLFTAGGVHGAITVGNLARSSYTHSGIIARGPITADIHIDICMDHSDIIGSSITGSVWIGWQAKGAIVATGVDNNDANAGRIERVEIGFSQTVPPAYIALYHPGFIGLAPLPLNAITPEVWYEPLVAGDGSSADAVIRTEPSATNASIGVLRISHMTKVYQLPQVKKEYIPRVESPHIEYLEIGDCREGSVWSGRLEFNAFDVVENDRENDYATVDQCYVGCIGPAGELWVQDCPRIEVLHDVLGEIYVPSLASTELIWIGDRLGDGPLAHDYTHESAGDICACVPIPDDFECYYSFGTLDEESPRDTNYADKSAVIIREAFGLAGQIIINGNNTSLAATTGWKGAVIVGEDGVSTPIVLSPSESDPLFAAPYYELPSADVGGGAVGLVPFQFYPTDCIPPHGEIDDDDGPTYTAFNSSSNFPVILRWYGPIGLPRTTVDQVVIECSNPNDDCSWFDLTMTFNPVIFPLGQKRAVGLQGGAGVPKDGVYHIRYELYEDEEFDFHEDRFFCDDVLGSVRVGPFPENTCGDPMNPTPDTDAYLFRIQVDCNGNDIPDAIDIANSPDVLPPPSGNGIPDLDENENGEMDMCEIQVCECDWDVSGLIGVPDIFAFLSDWFAQETDAYCFGGTCGVSAIFAFLSCWFAHSPSAPC